jgi:hypothetical protein
MTRLLLISTLALALPASAFDHAELDAILKAAVKGARVDYAAVKSKRPQLKAYLKRVAAADTKAMKGPERMAFLVNAYNALALDAVLEHKLPGSGKGVLDVPGFFDKKTYVVGGVARTLNKLEEQARPPRGPADVHFVVNCASVSCPPLAPFAYTAEGWKKSLASQTRKYLKGSVVVDDAKKTITVVKLFEWYEKDFGGKDGVRAFLARYGYEKARDASYSIVTREYDWKLNGA